MRCHILLIFFSNRKMCVWNMFSPYLLPVLFHFSNLLLLLLNLQFDAILLHCSISNFSFQQKTQIYWSQWNQSRSIWWHMRSHTITTILKCMLFVMGGYWIKYSVCRQCSEQSKEWNKKCLKPNESKCCWGQQQNSVYFVCSIQQSYKKIRFIIHVSFTLDTIMRQLNSVTWTIITHTYTHIHSLTAV